MPCILTTFRRFADFRGRSRRREFWTWFLFTWIVSSLLRRLDRVAGLALGEWLVGTGPLSAAFALLTLAPGLAVTVRRLHDTNRRWWWLLLPVGAVALVFGMAMVWVGGNNMALGFAMLSILLGGVAALLVILCLNGTAGSNRFGPDPKDPAGAVDLAEVFR